MTVVMVFRSRLRPEARAAYDELAPRLSELARSMPGYISHKVFTAEDGERVTIVEFADMESQKAWGQHAEHAAAQKRGRAEFYSEYDLKVCTLARYSKKAPA
jgi:heme-degrading monooxygenase HmoA